MRPNNRTLRKKRDTGYLHVFPVDDVVSAIKAEERAEEEAQEWESERGSFVAEEIERETALRARQRQEEAALRAKSQQEEAEALARQRLEGTEPPAGEEPDRADSNRSARAAQSRNRRPNSAASERDVTEWEPPRSRRRIIEQRERRRAMRLRRRRMKRILRLVVMLLLVAVAFILLESIPRSSKKVENEPKTAVALPALETRDLTIGYGKDFAPEDFLKSTEEEGFTYSFTAKPDSTLLDKKQDVRIQAVDADGNQASGEAKLSVLSFPGSAQVEAGTEEEEAKSTVLTRFDTETMEGWEEVNLSHVDSYPLSVEKDGKTYLADVEVVDTVAPVFSVRNMKCNIGYEVKAKEFVTEVEDATDVSFSFGSKPDVSGKGKHALVIIAEDEGGNHSRHTAFLTLGKDTEPPVFDQANDFTSFVGDSIKYKEKVEVSDNFDSEITIDVDSSKVDPTKPGTYPVEYTATDAAGNSASTTLNITLGDFSAEEAEVITKADEIISQIITDGMSDKDKTWAIYEYIRDHVNYVSSSEKDDYMKAARQGLVNGSGDCYVFRSVAKLLLDEAG
ncbi:MAG: hypothetical protein IJ679_10390, partial [Lachnospiraceae bacterium]|nr:hypothetical protein [Lachnospiraceae bacterium]